MLGLFGSCLVVRVFPPAIVLVDVIHPGVGVAIEIESAVPSGVWSTALSFPFVLFSVKGVSIKTPVISNQALVPSKSWRWREIKNTEVFDKATVPGVGAVVATAIAMAIVAVVVIALLEPKAAGHSLNVRSSCAFGASDGIRAIA